MEYILKQKNHFKKHCNALREGQKLCEYNFYNINVGLDEFKDMLGSILLKNDLEITRFNIRTENSLWKFHSIERFIEEVGFELNEKEILAFIKGNLVLSFDSSYQLEKMLNQEGNPLKLMNEELKKVDSLLNKSWKADFEPNIYIYETDKNKFLEVKQILDKYLDLEENTIYEYSDSIKVSIKEFFQTENKLETFKDKKITNNEQFEKKRKKR